MSLELNVQRVLGVVLSTRLVCVLSVRTSHYKCIKHVESTKNVLMPCHAISSHSADKDSDAPNPFRGQPNSENEFSLSPFAPESMVSLDMFGRPVPRQPVHSIYPS